MSPRAPVLSGMSRRVARAIRQQALLGDGDRVALAVSGGGDSVAMAWLLRELEPAAGWRLAGLVHVNHGLRGAESDADEAFCRDLAGRLGLPIEVARVDAAALARRRRRSIEAAAREARYLALGDMARTLGATRVATGHTADDQAETVLLRLFRGAGTRGVSGVRARRGLYVRPLLGCRRSELRGYLEARGETCREDSSNLDLTVPRNRLRHTLMPIVERDWPGAVAALARFAALAGDDEALLTRLAAEVMPVVGRSEAGGVQLDVRALGDLPPALARRVVRGALESAGGVASLRDIEAVRRLAQRSGADGKLDLRQVSARREGDALRLERAHGRARPPAPPAFEYPLPVPGAVTIVETGCTVEASLQQGDPVTDLCARGERVVLPVAAATLPLVVRNRRPGDRIRPLGAPGWRKLQDVFVDRKVPSHDRARVPLVVDARGRILWVAGVTIAEECRRPEADNGVVILQMKKGHP